LIGPIWLIATSTESRTSIRYGSRSPQYITLELGHVLENLRLTSWGRDLSLQTFVSPSETPDWLEILGEEPKLEFIAGFTKSSNLLSDKYKLTSGKLSILDNDSFIHDYSIEETIRLRSSVRDYLDKNITKSEIETFFRLFLGINNKNRQVIFPGFSNNSLLDYTMFVGEKITDINPGVYNINSSTGSFVSLENTDKILDLQQAGLDQQWIGSASFSITISSKNIQLTADRLSILEAGVAGQRFYHTCTLTNLGMVVIGAFYDNQIQSLIQSTGQPLYIIPIGPVERSIIAFQLESIPITLRTIGNIAGILAVFLFLIMAIFHTNAVKTLFHIKSQKIHYFFASMIIFFVVIHVFILIGYYSIRTGEFSQIFDILIKAFLPPPLDFELAESVGQFFARMALWMSIALILIMLPLKVLERIKPKFRTLTHNILFIVIIGSILVHSFLNSNILNRFQEEYISLVIIGMGIWYLIHQYSKKQTENKKSID
ncbi:MAG: hypothetical protein HeimC3_31190, partial [Candidatus Heimdallarchaeota archaeon LC_3]